MSLLSGLCWLACGTLLYPLTFASAQQQMYGKEIYHNGPYQFLNCDPKDGEAMIPLFRDTGAIISNDIIPELQSPTFSDPTQDPFATFFSSNRRKAVARVFQMIVGPPTAPASHRPAFICLYEADRNSGNPRLAEGLLTCDKPGALAATHFTADGIDIVLCPKFFGTGVALPWVGSCPIVNTTDTRYWMDSELGISTQFESIIHELVHAYSPDPFSYSGEIYDHNALMYKSPTFQRHNPENYALFALCVYLKCQHYPSIDRQWQEKEP